jgi:hypothetical protein
MGFARDFPPPGYIDQITLAKTLDDVLAPLGLRSV